MLWVLYAGDKYSRKPRRLDSGSRPGRDPPEAARSGGLVPCSSAPGVRAVTFLVTRPREQYPRDALAGLGGDPRGRLRAAAWLAQLAYEDDERKVDSIAADWSLRRLLSRAPRVLDLPWQPETRLHVLAPAGGTPGPSIVTICGTDPLRFANWATDLTFLPGTDDVHSGFRSALDVAWTDLEPVLHGLTGPVWVVGHSLGAAIAALCALQAHETLARTPEAVYAFGMPRVGGDAFVARYEPPLGARTLRLVHGTTCRGCRRTGSASGTSDGASPAPTARGSIRPRRSPRGMRSRSFRRRSSGSSPRP
jgi:Lipase (class 3)